MGLFSGWFKKGDPEDYEQVLSTLADDIQKRQTHLADIRLHERRITLLGTLYTVGAWAAYVGVWYANPGLLPSATGRGTDSTVERGVKGAPVVLGPIFILLLRRIVQIIYGKFESSEEKRLEVLRKQQRDKIEEFKKKTKYYETRTLLERFDDGPSAGGPPGEPRPPPGSVGPSPMTTPQRSTGPSAARPPQGLQPIQPGRGPVPGHLMPTPQTPMPPPRRQWYDKVADALLGDDEGEGSASSRYALICQKCFAHNGLVKESMWEAAQYVCPKCGHFNPSARAIKNGTAPRSPLTAMQTPITPLRGGSAAAGVPSQPFVRAPTAKGAAPHLPSVPAGAPATAPMMEVLDAETPSKKVRNRSKKEAKAKELVMEVDS